MSPPTLSTSVPPSRTALAAVRRSVALERSIRLDPGHYRMLTGDRPTGPLHLGHYFGSLLSRVELSQLGVELFVVIADYQTITDRDSPASLPADVLGLVADYMAVGIDPGRATIFAHSQVTAIHQLMLPFLSLVRVAELRRNPTVKEEFEASGGRSMSALMFTYPVHQAADILSCRANLVPVGRDQLPHVELTRTIARRFNDRYCADGPIFAEPEALLSTAPLLLGIDGQKMSKSRQNALALRCSDDDTARLVMRAKTDGERHMSYEPERRPEVANLVLIAAVCLGRAPESLAEEIGGAGAEGLKRTVTEAVNEHLRPIRARRAELTEDPAYLAAILHGGTERAIRLVEDTLQRVRKVMHTLY